MKCSLTPRLRARASARSAPCARCAPDDKASAVAELQATKSGLGDHLETKSEEIRRKASSKSFGVRDVELEDIEDIDITNYYEKINGAPDAVVVVDFYTPWCGPCKLMYPRLVELKASLKGKATFYKFNCCKKNKELGVKLGIAVAPTFLVYKNGEEHGRITGAKEPELRNKIDDALS